MLEVLVLFNIALLHMPVDSFKLKLQKADVSVYVYDKVQAKYHAWSHMTVLGLIY